MFMNKNVLQKRKKRLHYSYYPYSCAMKTLLEEHVSKRRILLLACRSVIQISENINLNDHKRYYGNRALHWNF